MKKHSTTHLDQFARRVAEDRAASDELVRPFGIGNEQGGIRSLLQVLNRGVYRVWSYLIGAGR
jgi:hypothetical protein